jgi:hypothetical protein
MVLRRWCRRSRRDAERAQAVGMGQGAWRLFVRQIRTVANTGIKVARKGRWRREKRVVA